LPGLLGREFGPVPVRILDRILGYPLKYLDQMREVHLKEMDHYWVDSRSGVLPESVTAAQVLGG
jgi:hypothetical protein